MQIEARIHCDVEPLRIRHEEDIMDRRIALTTTMMLCAGLALGTSDAKAQQSKDQLVGSWIFVSSTTKAEDGSPF